jgi:hypothetical protein
MKGGTNKINAACHPQAFLFSVFYPKLAQRRTIKVGSGAVTAIQMVSYCFKPKALLFNANAAPYNCP